MSATDREERFYKWANGTAPARRKGYALSLHKAAKDVERSAKTCVSCGSDGGKAGIGGVKRLCVGCELATAVDSCSERAS